jgi:PhoPQ-activated pathogenicity-related protein
MKRPERQVLLVGLASALLGTATWGGELQQYVEREDPSFSWKVTDSRRVDHGTIADIALVSQTWQNIRWEHRLRVYEAATTAHPNAMLLFITGGGIDSKPSAEDDGVGFALSRLAGTRVAVLRQVPNQPLLGGKTEDTLIAETFVRYLDTKDPTWPLLLPMVKSAVKAMDALQAWAKDDAKPVPAKFVVTGASKRGWTTWLTGSVDPRVIAIAPMVIDTLNFTAQRKHYLEVWGKPSEQIGDYTSRGLNERLETPDGKMLTKIVDPHSYLDRLTLPKLLINGTNDRYWTLDALNIYWDDLQGPKSVVYLPNAGHGLQEHRDYALAGVGALVRHAVTGRPFPKLDWKHADATDGKLRLSVTSTPPARSARLWVARSETRDFRKARWETSKTAGEVSTFHAEEMRPESGYIALFGDLEYEVDGFRYHLSTQVRQAGTSGER